MGDYTYNLAKEFVKNGHEVAVICKTDAAIAARWENTKEGIEVYPIGGTWQIKDYQRVLGTIKVMKPDRILFQYVPGGYNQSAVPWLLVYFFVQLRKIEIPVVTTFHEVYVRYDIAKIKYLYTAIGQRIITGLVAKLSNYIITSIDRYERQLKRWNKQVIQIPIGSNILPVQIGGTELQQLKIKIAPNGEKIISTFGIRDHKVLLGLFEEVIQQHPQTVLLICGKLRADLSFLPQSIQDKIYITGFLDAPDVHKHLKASDVFVMLDYVSPKGEGGTCNKSTSLAAGFAAGLPIFATKGDMTNKLLLESDIHWLPYNDPKIAAALLCKMIKNENALLKQNEASLNFFNRCLAWRQIYKIYSSNVK